MAPGRWRRRIRGMLTSRTTFTEICTRHRPGLVRACRRLTGSPEAAEDLAQEALILVGRRLDRLPADTNFAAYLWVTARNLAYAAHRRSRPAYALDDMS